MSRRTPIKELLAEEAGTPSSPIRRSSRIATRRSSAHEESGSQKSKSLSQEVDDSDRISISSTSSIGSKSEKKSRTASISLDNEDIAKFPIKRTRKGSTSSLIEEELVSINRGGSPAPGRITRRSLARSLSVSPVSELESRTKKTGTPQNSVSESAAGKGGGKKGRRLSVSDAISPLESIKEVESSPKKENSNKNSIENTDEKDLPIKKKKSAFLQTITEKSFTGDLETDKTEDNINSNSDEVDKHDNNSEKISSASKNESNKVDIKISDEENKKPSLSLKPKRNSNSSVEERELIVVLNNIDTVNRRDKSKASNSSHGKEKSASKENTEPVNSEDENLNLHISESECSDGKLEKSLLNSPPPSNVNITKLDLEKETLVQVPVTIQSSKTLESDTNNLSIEVNDENEQESKNSYCEPMDVDVTVLDSSSSNCNQNDKETTSSDVSVINSTKDTEKSNYEKLNNTEIDNQIVTTQAESTNNCANALETPQEPELAENKDSSTHIDAAEKVSSVDLVESSSLKTAPTKTSISLSPKRSSEAEVKHTELDLQTSPLTNKKHSIAMSPIKDLKSMQCNTSLDQSNISVEKETNNIIVATNTTPVRRSPRLSSSLDKSTNIISVENVPDVLKINTPPESIKSENSSRDTDLEVSIGEEHTDDVVENVSDNISKNINSDVEEITEKGVQNAQSKNCIEEEEETNISQTKMANANALNKSKTSISFCSEPELNATLEKKITALTEALVVDSSSDESVTNYIDDIAQEGEEDTPSESSNDIIDLGESIGSTESEIDSDESYELDSFIDDDVEDELLSGEEYDLDQEKRKPKSSKRKRIIPLNHSSDKDEDKDEPKIEDVQILQDKNEMKDKAEEESDIENMSTQPFCGLTPPSIVSLRESPSEEETKTFNNKDEEESITSVLINKEDNLESLEQIKDQSKDPDIDDLNISLKTKKKLPKKVTPIKITEAKTPILDRKSNLSTPNINIFESTGASQSDSKQQRKRLSSLTIQETVNVKDISDNSISDRILKVVEVFCSTVTKAGDPATGNISLNVSLDYVSTSPDKPDIHEEHKEVISVEPLRQTTFKNNSNVGSSTDKSESSKSSKRKQSKKMEKISPVKILFEKCSTSDEHLSDEENYQPTHLPKEKSKRAKVTTAPKRSIALTESSTKKNKKSAENQGIDVVTAEGEIDESPKRQKKKSRKTKKIEEILDQSDSDMSPDLDEELNEKYNNPSEDEDSVSGVENINIEETEVGKSRKHKNQIITRSSKTNTLTTKNKKKTLRTVSEHEDLESEDTSPIPSTSRKHRKKKYNEINPVETSQEPREKRLKIKNVSTEGGWQIQYLPQHIKVALSSRKPTMHSKSYITGKDQVKNIVPKKKPKLVPSLNSGRCSWSNDQLNTTIKPSSSFELNKNKELNSVIVEEFHPKDFKNRTLFDSKRVKRIGTKELLKKKEKMKF